MMTRSAPLPVPRSRTAPSTSFSGPSTPVKRRFTMRWTIEEWRSRSTGSEEIPVIPITDSLALFSLFEALQEEIAAVGIDIVPGPSEGKPVICIAVAAGVFAVDSGVVGDMDTSILLTFMRGVTHAKLVSFKQLHFSENDNLFPNVEKVSGSVRSRTSTTNLESLDTESLALHFGLSVYQARNMFLNPDSGPLSVYSKIASTKKASAPPLPKRQRTLVGAPLDPKVRSAELPIVELDPKIRAEEFLTHKPPLKLKRTSEFIPDESYIPIPSVDNPPTSPADALFVEDVRGDLVSDEPELDERAQQYMKWFD